VALKTWMENPLMIGLPPGRSYVTFTNYINVSIYIYKKIIIKKKNSLNVLPAAAGTYSYIFSACMHD
jgi:hypothetical protein